MDRFALHHDRDRLVRDGEGRSQLLAPDRLEPDVHRDHEVDAHLLCDVDRQVFDDPAVHEQAPVDFDRGEHARRRHARPHRGREVALFQHDAGAGFEIGRHGAKRSRQLVEVLDRGDRQRLEPERLREPLALDQAARNAKAAALDAERNAHEEFAVILLAAEVERVARGTVAERDAPVDAAHERVDLIRRHAGGIEPADYCAHAGAGDGVDRDVLRLERFQDTDVRKPARAAAGEHEADARARRRRRVFGQCDRTGKQRRRQKAENGQNAEHRGIHRVEGMVARGAGGGSLRLYNDANASDSRLAPEVRGGRPRSRVAGTRVRARGSDRHRDPKPGRARELCGQRNPHFSGARSSWSAQRTPSELLNRAPGTMIQRGSGQESLTALRSPVLTGAGGCGAVLVLEDGIPIRPVGSCNVNELFEVNIEQAAAVEVLRGPGSVLYGSSAVHGIINVIPPMPDEIPVFGAVLEGGSDRYRRLGIAASSDSDAGGVGLVMHGTDDGGWRDSSGFAEEKLNAVWARPFGDGALTLRLSGSNLDQQTAGFIIGQDAYRDPELARSNPDPEAYRDATSLRFASQYRGESGNELRIYLRSSRMDFLQHFLLGQPTEENGQDSGGFMFTATGRAIAGGER